MRVRVAAPGATISRHRPGRALHDRRYGGIYAHGTFTPLPRPSQGFQVGPLGINIDGVIDSGGLRGFVHLGDAFVRSEKSGRTEDVSPGGTAQGRSWKER